MQDDNKWNSDGAGHRLSNTINEDFICPGCLHECVRYGEEWIEKPNVDPQATIRPRIPNWQPLWVENIQVIGGSVFLGVRHVSNFKSADKDTGYTLFDTVMYENIASYRRIQRIGTWKKYIEEGNSRHEEHMKVQEELKMENKDVSAD